MVEAPPVRIDTRRARCGSRAGAQLAQKEYELLLQLAREPERVFTKAELLRDVWGYRVVGRTRTLDSHASRLRRKLRGSSRRSSFVENVWGVGYRLLGDDARAVGGSGRGGSARDEELREANLGLLDWGAIYVRRRGRQGDLGAVAADQKLVDQHLDVVGRSCSGAGR